MRLDVLIPTYNRQALLRRAVESLLAAEVPEGLEVSIRVVDNNSTDGTRALVEELRAKSGGRLSYLFEGRQGKSHALNSGIASTSGDLVGIIDDDEEVDSRWLVIVREAFAAGGVDFIGGPYVPRWGAEIPDWLPEDYPAVIGKVDCGSQIVPYGESFPGILMGGNAVISRAALRKVGEFSTEVGRIGEGMLCGEDEDMYRRLVAAGARGFYRPDLIIYHFVPPERLTKRYYRRWCFWRGVSSGMLDRTRREQVAYLAGVPRYLYGRAARRLIKMLGGMLKGTRRQSELFSNELAVWDLAGFFYGKHFYERKKGAQPAQILKVEDAA
ncbi:MAG TPA: glycosyltransferase [Pyrinomonadaceae bacterium]|jgi:glycosyltransferase involved in cell wall biosynthesis